MAYKRQSPLPINEGGTNTSSLTNTDGVIYFDGTKFNTTSVGSSGQSLTSQGAGLPPQFASSTGAGTISIIATEGLTAISSGSTTWTIPYANRPSNEGSLTQAQAQFPMPVAGTLSNMYVYIPPTGNSVPATVNVILNKNTVNTSLSVSVSNSASGTFSNTTDTVSVVAGDLIQFECNAPGGAMQGQIVLQLTT